MRVLLILVLISVPIFLISGVVSYSSLFDPRIEVWDVENNEKLADYPIETGDRLGVKFFHSYDKGEVTEYFIIQEDRRFLLDEVAFTVQSYDARELTYARAPSYLKDGTVYVENISEFYNEVTEEMLIRVPYTVSQSLLFNDQNVELSGLAESGTLLKIKIN